MRAACMLCAHCMHACMHVHCKCCDVHCRRPSRMTHRMRSAPLKGTGNSSTRIRVFWQICGRQRPSARSRRTQYHRSEQYRDHVLCVLHVRCKHVCCVYAACMLHVCCMYAVYMLHAIVHDRFMYATCMKHVPWCILQRAAACTEYTARLLHVCCSRQLLLSSRSQSTNQARVRTHAHKFAQSQHRRTQSNRLRPVRSGIEHAYWSAKCLAAHRS